MALSFAEHVDLIADRVARAESALERADADAPVPGCPEWTAGELRDHMAGVMAFWVQQLRVADAGADGPDFDDEVRDRYRLGLDELLGELLAELREAGPDRPCWNWSGTDLHSAWVARRMANEFGVHCADALATAGHPARIPAELAADGIDELIDVFLDPDPDGDFAPVGTVLLDAGAGGSWTLEVGEGVRRTRRQPTAWVRGRVDQVLLDLWGRPAEASHEGDRAPMRRWREIATFN